jgi:hypothetical protein
MKVYKDIKYEGKKLFLITIFYISRKVHDQISLKKTLNSPDVR